MGWIIEGNGLNRLRYSTPKDISILLHKSFLQVVVIGAKTEAEAAKIARSVASSSLTKA